MRKWWLSVCLLCLVWPLAAQTNSKIRELQSRRGALQKEIAASEKMLLSTRKDVRSQLKRPQCPDRPDRATQGTDCDHRTRREDVGRRVGQTPRLGWAVCATSWPTEKGEVLPLRLRYSYRNRFGAGQADVCLFSADDLAQTYRRLRYVREYGDFQRRQAEDIMRRQKEIEAKQSELREVRTEQRRLARLADC